MQRQQHRLSIFSCLDSYDTAIKALFEAIALAAPTSTNDDPNRVDKAIDTIIAQNQAYSTALDEVYEHRMNHKTILALKQESTALDAEISGVLSSLAAAQEELFLSSTKAPDVTSTQRRDKIEYATLLRYAERIAKHSQGQRDSGPHTDLHWPSEDMMRRGVLAATAYGGPPKTPVDAKTTEAHTGSMQDPTSTAFLGDVVMEAGDRVEDGAGKGGANAMALDLDLFDPDEDD